MHRPRDAPHKETPPMPEEGPLGQAPGPHSGLLPSSFLHLNLFRDTKCGPDTDDLACVSVLCDRGRAVVTCSCASPASGEGGRKDLGHRAETRLRTLRLAPLHSGNKFRRVQALTSLSVGHRTLILNICRKRWGHQLWHIFCSVP